MSDRLNYNTLAPTAMKALGGVHVYLHSQADFPKNLIVMAYLRTSQIADTALDDLVSYFVGGMRRWIDSGPAVAIYSAAIVASTERGTISRNRLRLK